MIDNESVLQQRRSLVEVVKEKTEGLFKSNQQIGVIGEADIDVDGQAYSLRYFVGRPQDSIGFARISLFDPTKSQSAQGEVETEMDMPLEDYEIAARSFTFSREEDTDRVKITSASTTRPGFESRGFGTALGLLSNIVITDVIERRLTAQLHGQDIYATIVDVAEEAVHGSGVKREGWSSWMAEQLGYQKSGIDEYGNPLYTKDY